MYLSYFMDVEQCHYKSSSHKISRTDLETGIKFKTCFIRKKNLQ